MSPAAVLQDPRERALSQWGLARQALPGRGLAWLEMRRQAAIDRFEELGYPAQQNETWRFTPIASLIEKPFVLANGAAPGLQAESFALCPFDAYRLVFINGRYAPSLSRALPSGVALASLAEFLGTNPERLEPWLGRAKANAFSALNTAFFADGAVLHLTRGTALDKPVHLLFISSPEEPAAVVISRVLIVAEPGARAQIIEEYAGQGDYLANAVTEIFLEENASLEYCKLQRESLKAAHIASLVVRQEAQSVFAAHSVALGGALARNDVEVRLEGEGADCTLNGLYLVDGSRHVDNSTVIDHVKPHGSSRELYKGVLDGQSRAVFNGTIVVEPAAQKTSAVLYNKNLLLSEQGLVNTKPEFKINANDVQCKHGATIGQLSPDSLFYLRSRGLDLEAAKRALVYAFASEMIDKLALEPIRLALESALEARFLESKSHD